MVSVKKLVSLLELHHPKLTKNCIAALKNLIFLAGTDVKMLIMSELGFDNIFDLITSNNTDIRVEALMVVRNFAIGELGEIEFFVDHNVNRLLPVLIENLSSSNTLISKQSLYLLANIAASGNHDVQVG